MGLERMLREEDEIYAVIGFMLLLLGGRFSILAFGFPIVSDGQYQLKPRSNALAATSARLLTPNFSYMPRTWEAAV
jgi:hypothetical protein